MGRSDIQCGNYGMVGRFLEEIRAYSAGVTRFSLGLCRYVSIPRVFRIAVDGIAAAFDAEPLSTDDRKKGASSFFENIHKKVKNPTPAGSSFIDQLLENNNNNHGMPFLRTPGIAFESNRTEGSP
jgi:hypothetical protein